MTIYRFSAGNGLDRSHEGGGIMKVLKWPVWFFRIVASFLWSVWFRIAVVLSVLLAGSIFTNAYKDYWEVNLKLFLIQKEVAERHYPFPFHRLFDSLFPIFLFWGVSWIVNGIRLWYIQKKVAKEGMTV
jgi:hypothetical protein